MSMVADGAGDAILGAVYTVKLGMTTQELADTRAPYLTRGEGLRLAAQAFTPRRRHAGVLRRLTPDPATSGGGSSP